MSAPERIYLQWFEDDAAKFMPEGVTWCADRIEDDDVEYVRADKAAAEMQTLRAVLQDIVTEGLIPAEYPLLMARVKAALGGGA